MRFVVGEMLLVRAFCDLQTRFRAWGCFLGRLALGCRPNIVALPTHRHPIRRSLSTIPQVFKQGLAKSIHHARVLIKHRHIR